MILKEPKIFLIGETKLDHDAVVEYLQHVGASDWLTNATTDVEYLCELYGRGCYASFNTEQNKNITRIRKGNKTYLENIIRSRHGSVLEHPMLNFQICDVSRVFTHELVRHRVGVAISEQSHRYYRSDELGFWIPQDLETISTENGTLSIQNLEETKSIIVDSVSYLEGQMKRLSEIFSLDEKISFDIKKRLNTIVRRIAPEGRSTDIGWSCNIRTLRHLLEARTNRHAEEEIRLVFSKIGQIVQKRFTNLFGDYTTEMVDGYLEFTTEYSKV